MKILHTADWHIGQFKGPVVDGVNLRSQDTVKCLEYMVQVAIEEKDKIGRDVVTAEQQACFERYMKLGAMCFLVVSLEFKEFYRVPWVVFRDMKKIYGHKYMNREELEPYRIKYSNGVVKYLDGIVLRERNEDESTEV